MAGDVQKIWKTHGFSKEIVKELRKMEVFKGK
jgi:hypothetical protein